MKEHRILKFATIFIAITIMISCKSEPSKEFSVFSVVINNYEEDEVRLQGFNFFKKFNQTTKVFFQTL